MKRHSSLRFLAIFLLYAIAMSAFSNGFAPLSQAAVNCSIESLPALDKEAYAWMKSNRLIRDGEESQFPALGLKTQWMLLKVVPSQGSSCLVVMGLCELLGTSPECTNAGAYEVLRLLMPSKRLVAFEDTVTLPKTLVARIGTLDMNDPSYYFVEFTGDSVVAALKSVQTKTPYYGFSGTAVRGKKAAFDPTPGRDWKIVNGRYDLRRGMTGEGFDVQAFQFDGLGGEPGDGYWKGCVPPQGRGEGYCLVAPWSQSYIKEIVSSR